MPSYSTVLRYSTCFLVGSLCFWLGVGQVSAQKLPPSEQLFPIETKAFLAVTDVDTLRQQWDKTQLGQLMADPVMKPFADDLAAKVEQRLGGGRLQLKLDDLQGVPSGEIAIGAIRLAPDEAAVAAVADVTGNLAEAEALLKKVDADQQRQEATRSVIAQGANTIIRFDLKPEAGETGPPRKLFYCLAGNALVASDNQQVLTAILARLPGGNNVGGAGSLAATVSFRAVMERCAKDVGNTKPQIRWFIEPLGYMEIVRMGTPEDRRPQEIDLLRLAQAQGFDGLKGAGGFIDLAVGGFEAAHRTYVYAPGPFEKAMKMFLFPPSNDFAPQSWVPRDVATYSTGYVDIHNAFDNFDSLFDHIFGQGEEGIWQDVLAAIWEDPNGPHLKVRDELVEHLGSRVSILTDYELPITPTSERLLVAIELLKPEEVATAIKKIMDVDPTARPHKKIIRSADGTTTETIIWEMVEEELPESGLPDVRLGGGIPSLSLGDDDDDDDDDAEPERLLPHAAITVVHGHLFIASHLDFLSKVIQPAGARATLGRSLDYRMVDATLNGLGVVKPFARTFNRSDESSRATYELIRQGKMPESETVLGRLINAVLGSAQSGVDRSQRIDGKNLPPFDTVRRYLGPAGMVVGVEPDGWFFKGILLNKEMR